jgi:hypothetical protein
VSRLHGEFVAFAVAIAATPELAAAGEAATDALLEALAPHATRGHYLNFAERPVDARAGYDSATWERLCSVRAAVDPAGVFMANHQVGD